MSSSNLGAGIRTRKSTDERTRPAAVITAASNNVATKQQESRPGSEKGNTPQSFKESIPISSESPKWPRESTRRSPWSCTRLTFAATVLALGFALTIVQSFLNLQLDPKGAAMSYMRPSFIKFPDFDTEHTRLATKYSLYLYREGGVHPDYMVRGVPVLFIPGNAGSYKQVRPLAAEAAVHYYDHLRNDQDALNRGTRELDFFSVDFNEDITAFHGQTLVEQAEYLNEAVAYILSLYHHPRHSARESGLPDPTSVILVGHSMGGIVARAMLTQPNYLSNSINTIVTLAAPHARAPVSFDSEIVEAYSRINSYWRKSYAEHVLEHNPLQHVTTISIAGGGLDTIVPSDYSTLASIVPPTHGFTVFTSTMPKVWTGMDHLAITWCDQLRKAVVPALYDVIDATRPNQTKPRQDRMDVFRRRFLTGMEDVVRPLTSNKEADASLIFGGDNSQVVPQGQRLLLRGLDVKAAQQTYLLPIPPHEPSNQKRFTLLTDQEVGGNTLDVMLCSVYSKSSINNDADVSMLVKASGGTAKLSCKDASSDQILLPASTSSTKHPFDNAFEGQQPFHYLQYNVEDLSDQQFVAVVVKNIESTSGWVLAEFSSRTETTVQTQGGFVNMLSSGIEVSLPAERAMVHEIKIPSIHSSLLAYKLDINTPTCSEGQQELFAPLLRQHIADPYESKFFVNARHVDVSMHGLAPFMPPSLQGQSQYLGLSLQMWIDPSCEKPVDISLKVDFLGSMGKLWMRYRVAIAAFPLLVVALVMRKQFQRYDLTGTFMSFTESMDLCLRSSIPVLVVGLTMMAMSLSQASQAVSARAAIDDALGWRANATETVIDFTVNDLLLGSQDPFFWFLVPMFGTISIGVCVILNYAVLCITHTFAAVFSWVQYLRWGAEADSQILDTFRGTSGIKRTIMTSILLLLVASFIPYQFVFVVLCLVQIVTCTRALAIARKTNAGEDINFYNYAHSILLLLLWILPINIPVLIVWVHNLLVPYLTPFSSYHNVLSIMPFVLLIETLSTGKMVPPVKGWIRHLTNILFFSLSVYAAVYGISFAYLLHAIVNLICTWLTAIHASETGVLRIFGNSPQEGSREKPSPKTRPHDVKKHP